MKIIFHLGVKTAVEILQATNLKAEPRLPMITLRKRKRKLSMYFDVQMNF